MLNHIKNTQEWDEKSLGAKGFTLIELLVVIIILGILAAVAIFAVGNIGTSSKVNACKSEKDTLTNAVEAYNAQTVPSGYPANVQAMIDGGGKVDNTNQPVITLKTVPKYWEMKDANGNIQRIPGTLTDVSQQNCG